MKVKSPSVEATRSFNDDKKNIYSVVQGDETIVKCGHLKCSEKVVGGCISASKW